MASLDVDVGAPLALRPHRQRPVVDSVRGLKHHAETFGHQRIEQCAFGDEEELGLGLRRHPLDGDGISRPALAGLIVADREAAAAVVVQRNHGTRDSGGQERQHGLAQRAHGDLRLGIVGAVQRQALHHSAVAEDAIRVHRTGLAASLEAQQPFATRHQRHEPARLQLKELPGRRDRCRFVLVQVQPGQAATAKDPLLQLHQRVAHTERLHTVQRRRSAACGAGDSGSSQQQLATRHLADRHQRPSRSRQALLPTVPSMRRRKVSPCTP